MSDHMDVTGHGPAPSPMDPPSSNAGGSVQDLPEEASAPVASAVHTRTELRWRRAAVLGTWANALVCLADLLLRLDR